MPIKSISYSVYDTVQWMCLMNSSFVHSEDWRKKLTEFTGHGRRNLPFFSRGELIFQKSINWIDISFICICLSPQSPDCHSLHALKDESFLRQTMQRQAATLHHASISYAVSFFFYPQPTSVFQGMHTCEVLILLMGKPCFHFQYDQPVGISASGPPKIAPPPAVKKPLVFLLFWLCNPGLIFKIHLELFSSNQPLTFSLNICEIHFNEGLGGTTIQKWKFCMFPCTKHLKKLFNAQIPLKFLRDERSLNQRPKWCS